MNIEQLKSIVNKNSAKVQCNPQATEFLIEIIRGHTNSKFTLTINAGVDDDDGSVYDEFSLGDDNLGTILCTINNELMVRLTGREDLN